MNIFRRTIFEGLFLTTHHHFYNGTFRTLLYYKTLSYVSTSSQNHGKLQDFILILFIYFNVIFYYGPLVLLYGAYLK